MSGRDLLYKPPVPTPLQDEGSEQSKDGKARSKGSRDLGGVGDILPTQVKRPAGSKPVDRKTGQAAYKASYFNQDTSGVRQANLNSSGQRALRGSSDATNLRNVALPPTVSGIETPDPEVLGSASAMMGIGELSDVDLESLLARQNLLAQGEGVTVEMIEARMQQLEAMTEARRAALARMAAQSGPSRAGNATLEHASAVNGNGVDATDDLLSEGSRLIRESASQAEGMHRRIAKALGMKLPKS